MVQQAGPFHGPTMTSASGLTPAQREELRLELEREVELLQRRIQRARAAGKPVELDQTTVGRLSRMDTLQNQGLAAGAHARAHLELSQVLDALARLEAGTYGLCQTCGRQIPYERLSVMPEARECQACSRQAHR